MAASSGPAISARPSSIKPLRDLGRAHCMEAILPGVRKECLRMATCRRPSTTGACARHSSPGIPLQSALPFKRGAHDCIEIIEARLPAKLLADALGAGDERRGVARAARQLLDP